MHGVHRLRKIPERVRLCRMEGLRVLSGGRGGKSDHLCIIDALLVVTCGRHVWNCVKEGIEMRARYEFSPC